MILNPYRFGVVGTDPYWVSRYLLIGANGVDGSSTILDESSYAKSITVVGGAQISTAQSRFGGSSLRLPSSGYVYANIGGALNTRTTSFCFETFIRFDSAASGQCIFSASNTGTSGDDLYANFYLGTLYIGDGVINTITTLWSYSVDTWYHFALSFDGSTYRLFVDGALISSSTTLLKNTSITNFILGSRPAYLTSLGGYMDDARLTIGIPVYTTAFTPPTAQFPRMVVTSIPQPAGTVLYLNGDGPSSSSFTDASASIHTITTTGSVAKSATSLGFGGSINFPGGSDKLSIAHSDEFTFGSGDFGIEVVFKLNAIEAGNIIGKRSGYDFGPFSLIYNTVNSKLQARFSKANSAWDLTLTSDFDPVVGTTYRYSVNRVGNTIHHSIDGRVMSSGTLTGSLMGNTSPVYIGATSDNLDSINCLMDELIVTKGAPIRTGAFTPPTLPWSTDPGMDLYWSSVELLIPGNTGATPTDISQRAHSLNIVGITPSSSDGGYLNCPGTALSRINIASSSSFGFGTGDYTLECDVWLTVDVLEDDLFDNRTASGPGVHYLAGSNQQLAIWDNSTNVTGAGSVTRGEWAKLAYSRKSGVVYAFINGVQQWTTSYTSDFGSNRPMAIGSNYVFGGNLNGRMRNIRITKGVGRYTGSYRTISIWPTV